MIIDLFNTLSHFYGQYAKQIHEVLALVISVVLHFLDVRQSILARILHFPHLFHNVYVYYTRQYLGKVIYSIVVIFWNVYAYLRWKGTRSFRPIQMTKTTPRLIFLFGLLGNLATCIWIMLAYFVYNKPLSLALAGDAFYSVFGIIEKWFMSHKKLERWILASSRYVAFAMACYAKQDFILMWKHILLIFVALYGQFQWAKSYRNARSTLA